MPLRLEMSETNADDMNESGIPQTEDTSVMVKEEQGGGPKIDLQEEKPFTGTLAPLQIRPLATLKKENLIGGQNPNEESVGVKEELRDLKPFSGPLAPLQINSLAPLKNENLQDEQIFTGDAAEVNGELQDLKPFTGPLVPLAIQPVPPPVRPPPPNKKFTCVVCKKGVGTEGGLKYHLRTHLLGRPFKCDVCDRTFATKNDLDTHSRRHAEKFFCDFCNKECPAKDYLKSHISWHHLPKYIPCVNCCKKPRFFSTKKTLQQHYFGKKRAGKSLAPKAICKLCGARFANDKNYQKHCADRELLKFSCKTCGTKFPCFILKQAHIKKEKSERKKMCVSCKQKVKDLKTHHCVKRVMFPCKKCKSFETDDVNVLVSHTKACGVKKEVRAPTSVVAPVLRAPTLPEKPRVQNPPEKATTALRPPPRSSICTIKDYFGAGSVSTGAGLCANRKLLK